LHTPWRTKGSGMARPTKPSEERMTEMLGFTVTKGQRNALEAAAEADNRTLSAFIRNVMLVEVRKGGFLDEDS